ncbi:MAG TPA: carboxypeptidase regulatory-like domain-containing protein [Gemmatimonadaceae bacterium]
MIKLLRLCLAVPLIAFATPLGAQNTTPPTAPAVSKTGKGQIVGAVIDSLNGRYLSGAGVVIEGGRAALETDSLGRFQVDSLAPGTYQVRVFHPLLDTLGINLLTQRFHVGPDSSSVVILAVPSAMTLVHLSCRQSGPYGESAVIGHVSDPETLTPVARAEVSIAWTEIDITKELGLRRTPHLMFDSTDASGAFKICGLPNSMEATLQARRGSAITAEIPISLGDRPVELLARTVLLSSANSGSKSGNATVSGTVTLEGARTNAGTRVELVGTDIAAMTNEKGEFTMRNLPSGTKLLLARHLGFVVQSVAVDLSSRETQRVTIKLPKFLEMMDPVLVTARRTAALDKVGFNQRRKTGLGFYIGPERLEDTHPIYLTDILRQVPGLRVSYGIHGDVVTSSRGVTNGCVEYYLDDAPYTEMNPGDVNRFVTAREVVAVEVYQGPTTPAQYVRAGAICTTVVLWTRLRIRG